MNVQRSVVSSAKLIAGCTLLSRITGLARDILLAGAFGLGWVQDAWVFAFQFPHLFRRLFGEGAIAAAFVPTFTRMLEREGRDSAWQLLARTLGLMTVALSVLIVLIGVVLGAIWLFSGGSSEELLPRQLTLFLTALMLPFILTICIVALFSSILNCVGSFVPAALMPVLLNLCMIAAIVGLGPAVAPGDHPGQVAVIAFAVVAAGVLQILLIFPVLRRHGVRLGWQLQPRDPTVRRMVGLLVPVLFGQGMLAFGVFLDALVCKLLTRAPGADPAVNFLGWTLTYPLEEGALSAVTYAQRLYQFPLGVLVVSLGTAALPALSRFAARHDWDAWVGEARQALRLAVFEGVLAGTMMIMLAIPIVRLLFEHGQFTSGDTARAGFVLTCYGLGMWAFCALHIVVRSFYSIGDVRTPVMISALLLPLNVVLNLTLVWFDTIREAAFALSTATTSTLAVVVGLIILQRRVPRRLFDLATGLAPVRMLLAAGVTAGTLAFVEASWSALTSNLPSALLSRATETLGLLALGTIVFVGLSWALGAREATLLLRWKHAQ